jgi:hypothetical protein
VRTCLAGIGVVCTLSLAACGGGSSSTSAISQALKASPDTYYHFAGSLWWGRPVTVRTVLLHQEGSNGAEATVSVSSKGKPIASQTVNLVKGSSGWQVAAAEATLTQTDTSFGTVTGPVATRPPTAAEQKAIVAGALQSFPGEGNCLRFTVAVSKVDPAWASAVIRFVGPNRISCAVSGTPLLELKPSKGWRMVAIGIGGYPCSSAPPGVLRSLFGSCRIGGSSS